MSTLTLAVSIGCPSGIGPEVALAAFEGLPAEARLVLFGDPATLVERAPVVGVDPSRIVPIALEHAAHLEPGRIAVVAPGPALGPRERAAGKPTAAGGASQLAAVDAATDAVTRGYADALVTGPVSKAAIASSGAPGSAGFLGHTEHLGKRLGAEETVMAFWAPKLTVSLATTHLPLRAVADAITAEAVATATYWTAMLLDDLGAPLDRALAVLSLNPHAGEGGLLGDEETTAIAPGMARARRRLSTDGSRRSLVGPVPAEAALRQTARDGRYAGCVAMYHDQATIASKLVAFGDAVNVTLGLPIVRTSVDHGTAYDLAGTGRADAAGMRAAIELAVTLARKQRERRARGSPRGARGHE
jgi:4-hydroxythreonine-4-phosphate dehydrogenase